MTLIAPVGSTTTGTTGATSALGRLGSDAFLQLLVAQLRFQNPMAPSDPSSMLQQTAQFTQVETLQQLASSQQQLLGLQQASMAADLVGKEVTATGADGETISGVVDAIRFTADGPMLEVGEHSVPMASATEIRSV